MTRAAGRLQSVALAVAMGVFLVECLAADRADAPTYDETTHLPAGYLHLVRGDYRFQVDHPPLAKMIAATGAVLAGADAEGLPAPRWRDDLSNRFEHRVWGWRFLYRTPGHDADRLIGAGRLTMMAVGLAVIGVVWAWGRTLYGPGVALILVWLAAVDPNLVAHGHLVTADIAVTACMAGATYALWRALRRWRARTALLAGGLLGLGLATKYTALLLVPVAVLLPLARALERRPWPRQPSGRPPLDRRYARLAAAIALIGLLLGSAWVTLWAVYRFRPAAAPGTVVQFTARAATAWFPEPRSWGVRAVTGAVAWRLIPDAWGFGLLYLGADARLTPRTSYLAGRLSDHGWWYYFPVALAVKVPLGTLALALIGLGGAVIARIRRGASHHRLRGRPRDPTAHATADAERDDPDAEPRPWAAAVCGVAVPGILLGAAAMSSLDIGIRQVLPAYPFLLLAAGRGAVVCRTMAGRWGPALVAALAIWVAVSSTRVAPDYLAYFNELAGGPAHGVRWLVDSNLDWGQALRALPRWLEAHGIDEVNLCYFGTADPDAYGLRYVRLPGGTSYSQAPAAPVLPGYVAISATHLAGVHFSPELRVWYQTLLARGRLVGVVRHAIHVYAVLER